jgi:two-component system, NarL family, nitrate/nitrite response regulator NarL
VRLVLCDDHQLFAEPLAFALERRGHHVVVTTTPLEAVRAVDDDEPDVCLLDLGFPDEEGLQAIAALRRRHPLCAVLVLSATSDARAVEAARFAGAAGFVRKDQPLGALFMALARVAAGREPSPPPPVEQRGHKHGRAHQLVGELTRRERQVLGCLVRAQDTVAIARSLGVAPSTARTHLQSVLRKLGVNNRLQAVALVGDAGLEWDR